MVAFSSWFHSGRSVSIASRGKSRQARVRPRLERLEDRTTPAITMTLNPVTVNAVEGAAFNGTVATFTTTDPAPLAANFTATVGWGDGSVSPTVSVIADPVTAGLFDVVGTHTFAEEGTFRLTVNVTDVVNSVSATSSFVS